MTSAPGIGSAPATLNEPPARRAPRPPGGAERPTEDFQRLLDDIRPRATDRAKDDQPRSGRDTAAGSRGDARALAGWPGSRAGNGPLASQADGAPPLSRDQADGAMPGASASDGAAAGSVADVVALAIAPEDGRLVQQVAGRVAAALDGNGRAGGTAPGAATAAGSRTGRYPLGSATGTSSAGTLLPSTLTPDDGTEPAATTLTRVDVTRRETHFGPPAPGTDGTAHLGGRAAGNAAEAGTATRRGAAFEGASAAARHDAATDRASSATDIAANGRTGTPASRGASSATTGAETGTGAARDGAGAGPSRGASSTPTTGAASAVAFAPLTGTAGSWGIGGARFAAAPLLLHAMSAHAGPGPAKVLHIRLQPAELGTLEVRMRMSNGTLEIHVDASRRETGALLQRDRDMLAGILRGAGHSVDSVTISITDKAPGQTQGQTQGPAPQASQNGGQAPASGDGAGAQPGSTRDRGGSAEDGISPRRASGRAIAEVQDDQNRPARTARRAGGLYL